MFCIDQRIADSKHTEDVVEFTLDLVGRTYYRCEKFPTSRISDHHPVPASP